MKTQVQHEAAPEDGQEIEKKNAAVHGRRMRDELRGGKPGMA